MENEYISWAALSQRVIEKVKTSSALNPLLWLCGLALIPLLAGATFAATPINYICLTLAATVIVAPIIGFFVLLFRAPNRLQSEDYQIERFRLEHSLLGDSKTELFQASELSEPPLTQRPMETIENKT
jgi:hypothetical protein